MTALRQRMIEAMQIRGLSANTQRAYLQAIQLLAQHYHRPPDQLTDDDIRQYFLYLRNERQVARSTSTIALCAMKFLVEHVIHRPWPILDLIPGPPTCWRPGSTCASFRFGWAINRPKRRRCRPIFRHGP